jgi:hypothetical protein
MLHEGFEAQGATGKAGWTIGHRVIAVAMAQGGAFKMRSQVRSELE